MTLTGRVARPGCKDADLYRCQRCERTICPDCYPSPTEADRVCMDCYWTLEDPA